MENIRRSLSIDWILIGAVLPILAAGLVTMESFGGGPDYYLTRQLVWIVISLVVFFVSSLVDWRFLKNGSLLAGLFVAIACILLALFALAHTVRGVQSWLSFGGVSLQPVDFAKLILILVLAKYFSRRHIEIANIRHILISGLYAFIIFVLVFLQPDFGSAMIIFAIWLGMTAVSGISFKHLGIVFLVGALAFGLAWNGVLKPYQKERVFSFLNPLSDIRGTGYNAYQSTIAVGSGMVIGKGVGFGTQSRLKFLPEYQTDFIFAAFAEEWGFIGVLILFFLFGIILWRIVRVARVGASNFETLYALGFAILLMSHFAIHVGMNIGVLPVTGLPLPFMSYGGSHLVTEFLGLGILMSFRRYARAYHRDDVHNEFLGM